MKNIRLICKSATFLALVLLVAGCTITRKMQVTYNPGDASPLTSIKPMKFALAVQDDCPADEKGQLAHINKVIMVVDGGVESVVADALQRELTKAGHQVVPDAVGADAAIKVTIKRMRVAMRGRGAYQLVKTVYMQAEIAVVRTGQESRGSRFTVSETREKTYVLAATGAMEGMFNETFHNFVRNIIMDPQFIEPLQ